MDTATENNVQKAPEKPVQFSHFELTAEAAQVLMKSIQQLPFETIEPLVLYLRQNLIGVVKEPEAQKA